MQRVMQRFLAAALGLLLVVNSILTASPVRAETAARELFFTILHTNDEHSALLPLPLIDYDPSGATGAAGSFARLASAVNRIRAAKQAVGEPVLLLSAGDYLTGSPFAWLALNQQAPELQLMLSLGYDLITLGNHEFDFGSDGLARYFQAAGYPEAASKMPIVASNANIPNDHPLAHVGIQSTWVKTLDNGLRIGFFGILGKDATNFTPYATPVTFTDPLAAAEQAVAELKAAEADVIVAISHSGEIEDTLLAQAVPGIDVIIGGHTHKTLDQPLRVGDTIIAQAGSQLSHLGLLELAYDQETGKVSLRNESSGQPYLLPLDTSVPFDTGYKSQVDDWAQELDTFLNRLSAGRFQNMSQVILHTDFPVDNEPKFTETPFGNFVTDAMRLMGEKVTGEKVDFAFQANGVIRGGLEPGTLTGREGQVTLFDLVNQVGMGLGPDEQPGYPLVSIYFTGEEVRRILEITALLPQLQGNAFFLQTSGLRMEYDPTRAILATIPIKNLPIPTGRAVVKAERYTGSGVQQADSSWAPLKRGDQQLYHVVSDYYLAAFLPMVGEVLPSLGLVMKDKQGNPVEVDDCIVYRDGQEYKVWQAVLEYAVSQEPGSTGLPEMPTYYSATSDRIVVVRTLPIWLVPALFVIAVLALLVFWLRRRRARTA